VTRCPICDNEIAPESSTYDGEGRLICHPPCQRPIPTGARVAAVGAERSPTARTPDMALGRRFFIILSIASAVMATIILVPKGQGHDFVRACECSVLPIGGWLLAFFGRGRGLKWLVLFYGGLGVALGFVLPPLIWTNRSSGDASPVTAIGVAVVGAVCLGLALLCFSPDLQNYLRRR
jgi:hypothetical protein